jgi:Domain of unknown function (DUF5658)
MTGDVCTWPGVGMNDRIERLKRATVFGNWAIVLFLAAQGLDGIFTYVGLTTFGTALEANPLLLWLIHTFGQGPALAGAKLTAAGLGIALHLIAVHRAVALLTALYVAAAVLPWVHLLFISGRL